jgi:hypothetical protein
MVLAGLGQLPFTGAPQGRASALTTLKCAGVLLRAVSRDIAAHLAREQAGQPKALLLRQRHALAQSTQELQVRTLQPRLRGMQPSTRNTLFVVRNLTEKNTPKEQVQKEVNELLRLESEAGVASIAQKYTIVDL